MNIKIERDGPAMVVRFEKEDMGALDAILLSALEMAAEFNDLSTEELSILEELNRAVQAFPEEAR